jgi:ABC-type glucose/galactose transport system permease subunit
MTLAVAAVTCIQLLARIVDNEKFLAFSVFSIPVIFVIAAVITIILGLHSGEQVRSALEVDPPISGIAHKLVLGQLIIRYWQVYGPGLFFSSILAGGLIGYMWYRVIAYRIP